VVDGEIIIINLLVLQAVAQLPQQAEAVVVITVKANQQQLVQHKHHLLD
jgi:hypothetical protein